MLLVLAITNGYSGTNTFVSVPNIFSNSFAACGQRPSSRRHFAWHRAFAIWLRVGGLAELYRGGLGRLTNSKSSRRKAFIEAFA
jgi:hypothetical protein